MLAYGMNPSFHVWWGREIVFADAMRRASEFTVPDAQGQPTRNPARVRADYWPAELCAARLFGDMGGTIPAGNYVVTWDEDGSVTLRGSAVVREVSREARRLVVEVKSDGALFAVFTPPVKSVRIWLPGMEPAKPLFWPPYVAKVKAMNRGSGPHTWRTLDWTHVNDYGTGEFVFDLAGAITPNSPSQGTKRGICPEFQAQFCNAIGANLHFNIPHRTDEISEQDYVRFVTHQMRVLYRTLSPNLTLTVELSNEIWNKGFPQNRWYEKEGAARGLTLEQEVARNLKLFWPYLSQIHPRARRYLAGHTTTPDFVRDVLAAIPTSLRIDALGPACYFRPLSTTISQWMAGATKTACPNCPTPLQVIQAARLSLPRLRQGLREHRVMATQRGAKLELYEAGQSFLAGFQPWGTSARQAQYLPELYDAYVNDIIPMLVDEGVDLVNWYSFMNEQSPLSGTPSVGFGCWDNMDQTITLPVPASYLDERAPKAAAIYRGPPT
mgnify:CR=1 FL=1